MRKQRAFATLTDQEIDQIAEWLRHGIYDDVRQRIAKPRPEGFGLPLKSNRPLQTLFEKKNTVDKINRKVAAGEKLSITEFDAITHGERPDLSEKLHQAILETTYEIVMFEENTPTALLSLQRLADFPARAEYREHKVEMDLHRKELSEKRFALSERALNLREQLALKRSNPNSSLTTRNSPTEDDLGPLISSPEDIRRRARAKFGIRGRPAPEIQTLSENSSDLDSRERPTFQGHKLEAGSGTQTLSSSAVPSPVNPAIQTPTNPPPSSLGAPHLSSSPSPSTTPPQSQPAVAGDTRPPDPPVSPEKPLSETSSETLSSSVEHPVSPFTPDLPAFVQIAPPSLPSDPSASPTVPGSRSLEDRVNDYTLARHEEGLGGKETTKLLCCPCGHKDIPCPEHGEFPRSFWDVRPDSSHYSDVLDSKGLPYTGPWLLLQERERAQRMQAGRARLKQEDPDGSRLHKTAKYHAIRRWAYHLGPRMHVPFAHTWRTECPCGAELPCDAHDDLWRRLLYVYPWDKEYTDALAQERIPIYVPASTIASPAPSKTG